MDWIALEAMQKRKGLTNEDVAKKLGIDPATYYRKKTRRNRFLSKRSPNAKENLRFIR